jgi:WD40 repeat protein
MLFLHGRTASARRLGFSPDGWLLASVAEDDRVISVWDALSGRHKTDLVGHGQPVTCLAFDPTRGTLASGERDGHIRFWDVSGGKSQPRPPVDPTGLVTCLAFSPDGRWLAAGECRTGRPCRYFIRLLEPGKGSEREAIQGREQVVYCLAFSPDGQFLAVGTEEGATVWDLTDGSAKASLPPASTNVVRAAAFAADGGVVALAAACGAILWDTGTGEIRLAVRGQEGMATSVALAPDGRVLATASWGGVVRLWCVHTGRQLTAYDWRFGRMNTVAFSPDGMRLAAGGDSGIVIWDVEGVLG